MTKCRWCQREFVPPPSAPGKLYCDAACRAKWKRAEKSATIADLVEKLGPFVTDAGLGVYAELVGHLQGRVNADA